MKFEKDGTAKLLDIEKSFMKRYKVTKEKIYKMLENDQIKVLAMHPTLKKKLPYRIKKINEDGTIQGYFLE